MMVDATDRAVASGDPYEFSRMAESLVGEFPVGRSREWLEQSWADPQSYWAALYARARAVYRGFSSRHDATIDAYHDLVEVHLGRGRDAFCESADGHALRTTTYDALHSAVVALADVWRGCGVSPGQSLTVLSSSDCGRVVGVLAGLFLGLKVSLIEARGRLYVRNRLALLAPDHVAASADSLAWYGDDRPALPLKAGTLSGAASMQDAYRYRPDEPMLAFVSPLAEGADALAELTASACMSAILSDVQLLLPIQPGERVAAVGRDRGLVEPTLWLATFVAGGTYVDLDLDACTANPAMLGDAGVQVMLAGAGLVDTLLSSSQDLTRTWKRWSLDPSGKLAWQRWWALAERLEVRGVPGFNAVYVAPLGGCLAVSPKVLKPDPVRVIPAPGLPWMLNDVTGVGAPVPVDSGLLAVDGASPAQVGQLMVAGSQGAFGLAGSLRPRVEGCPFPEREVVELVEQHHAVRYAAVVVVADRAVMNHGSARLLLFVDPLWVGSQAAGAPDLCRQIDAEITEGLGAQARPDRVEAFALSPRITSGRVDPVWVAGQYLSGMLYKKQPMASFRAIAKLHRLFATESSAAPA